MLKRKRYLIVSMLLSLLVLSAVCSTPTIILLPSDPQVLNVFVHEDGTKTYEVNQAFLFEYRRMRLELGMAPQIAF